MRLLLWVVYLVAIGALVGERIAHSQSFSNFWQTTLALPIGEIAILIAGLAVPLAIVNIWDARARRPLSRRELVSIVLLIALVGLSFAFIIFDRTDPTPTIALVAAMTATIGWIVQRDAAINLSRKQHTLTALLQMRQSEVFNRHRINLMAHYPHKMNIPAEHVEGLMAAREKEGAYLLKPNGHQTFPVVDSILYICNYYEFFASAVRQGDIDDRLLRASLEPIIRAMYAKCGAVIEFHQKPVRGRPTTDIYNQLWWLLNKHWKSRPST